MAVRSPVLLPLAYSTAAAAMKTDCAGWRWCADPGFFFFCYVGYLSPSPGGLINNHLRWRPCWIPGVLYAKLSTGFPFRQLTSPVRQSILLIRKLPLRCLLLWGVLKMHCLKAFHNRIWPPMAGSIITRQCNYILERRRDCLWFLV